MSRSVLRIAKSGEPAPVVLATVELDRRAGVASHPRLGLVELVDHVTAWVLEDGTVLAAVQLRSVIRSGRVLMECDVAPAAPASLTATERHDVLHAAGLQQMPALLREQVRWEVA